MDNLGIGKQSFAESTDGLKTWFENAKKLQNEYIIGEKKVPFKKDDYRKVYGLNKIDALRMTYQPSQIKNKDELKSKLIVTQKQADAFKIDMSLFDNFDNSKAQNVLDTMQKVQDEITSNSLNVTDSAARWEEYFQTLDEGNQWQRGLVENNHLMGASLEEVKQKQTAARNEAEAANTSLQSLVTTTKLSSIAFNALAMVGNMVVTMLVSIAVQKAVEFFYNLATAADRAKESAEQFSEDFKSLQKDQASNTTTIANLSDEYDELSSHVDKLGKSTDLTSEQMDRYHEICNQIAEIMPELVDHYDEQGNAVLNLAKKYKTLNDAYEDNKRKAALEAYEEKDDNGKKYKVDSVFENYNNIANKQSFLPSKGEYTNKDANFFKASKVDQIGYLNSISSMNLNDIKEAAAQTAQGVYDATQLGISEAELQANVQTSGSDIITNILHQYGLDANSSDEEFQKAIDAIKTDAEDLQNELDASIGQMASAMQNYAQSKQTYWTSLSDDSKSYLNAALGNTTIDLIKKNGITDRSGMQIYVNNLMDQLSRSTTLNDAFKSLLSEDYDATDLDPGEIADKYSSAISKVGEALGGLNSEQVTDMFNVEDFNQTLEKYNTMLDDAKASDPDFDWNTWFKENSINTEAEIERWNEIATAANSAAEARATYTQEELPSFSTENIEKTRKEVEALKTALSTQSSNGYLSQADIKTLLTEDPNMEAALTDTVSGMKLDPKKVKELTQQNYELRDAEAKAAEASAKMKLDKTKKDMVSLAGSTEKYNQLLANIDSDSFDQLASNIGLTSNQIEDFKDKEGELSGLYEEISTWQQVQSEIRGATSLLKQYNDAQSTPNESDNYAAIVSGKKNADELYKQGWITKDDFTSYANMLGQYGDSEEDNIRNYKTNAKRLSKYLTEDRTGVEKFLNDSVKAGGIKQYTDENGEIQYEIESMDKLAQKMNVTTEFAEDLIRALNDAGYSFPIEPINEYTSALKEIDYGSDDAVSSVENVIKQMERL